MTDQRDEPHDQATRASGLLRPEDFGRPLAASIAGHHRHAILILDVNGTIRFAATRDIFGYADEELIDRHLDSLLPTLPLRKTTPGYNVAYVRVAFADRGWHRHRAVGANRAAFPIEVSVRALPIGRSYAFLAAIREMQVFDRASSTAAWRNALRAGALGS